MIGITGQKASADIRESLPAGEISHFHSALHGSCGLHGKRRRNLPPRRPAGLFRSTISGGGKLRSCCTDRGEEALPGVPPFRSVKRISEDSACAAVCRSVKPRERQSEQCGGARAERRVRRPIVLSEAFSLPDAACPTFIPLCTVLVGFMESDGGICLPGVPRGFSAVQFPGEESCGAAVRTEEKRRCPAFRLSAVSKGSARIRLVRPFAGL